MSENPLVDRDIINYYPDGGPSGGQKKNENENGREREDEAESSRRSSRRESLYDELIDSAETPEELFIGLRQLERKKEDGNIPPNLDERYTPPRHLSSMYDRAANLSYSIDELVENGWVTNYNEETGEAKLKDDRFAPLAIKAEQVEKFDSYGRLIGYEMKYNLGTRESRKALEKAYQQAVSELEARDVIGEHFGFRMHVDYRDDLEGLVEMLHSSRMPKLRISHLEALFNMPGLAELKKDQNNHILGDQVEEALFLNLVMLNSGTKDRMKAFLKRPGVQHLIAKMAKESNMTYQNWVSKNIGDVDGWVEDEVRELTTFKDETRDGKRGTITRFGNIPAFVGKPGEFANDDEVNFIEKDIAGLVSGSGLSTKGGIEAAWLSVGIMRGLGVFGSDGFVALKNGKSSLPLGEGRIFSGDDTGKFNTYLFNMKEGFKGRPTGLKDMIGRIPDMAMNLFDWAQVRVVLPDGTVARRSIWDAWLGTAEDVPIKDIVTMEETGKKTKKEEYHRLGDLNFKSLDREFHGTFTIMQWLAGRQGLGVYTDAMATSVKPEEFDNNSQKKRWKYIGIVMNALILTKGSPHLYDLGKETKEEIVTIDLGTSSKGLLESKINTNIITSAGVDTVCRRFFRNVNAAKIGSASFALNVLPSTMKIYNDGAVGGQFFEVPYANLVELNINQIAKDNFNSEDEILTRYVDDMVRMKSFGQNWPEAAEVRVRAKNWLSKDVGKVTGKNSF